MPFRAPRAGELRHRVELQDRDLSANAGAGLDEAYTTVATVWARILTIFGGRLLDGVQEVEAVTHTVTIRHRADQASWGFLRFDGRRFEVRRVMDPDERKVWLEILAEEIRTGA